MRRKRRLGSFIAAVSVILAVGTALGLASAPAARAENAAAAIRATLEAWTADFNAGRADKVCDLFARDLVAQF
ncbi:MAG TPA: hypothetical protein VHG27_09210, partial [Xanthobacteraceae bacterium]|nr:hypothetical protein [Xanthobacteraceae bacterium]